MLVLDGAGDQHLRRRACATRCDPRRPGRGSIGASADGCGSRPPAVSTVLRAVRDLGPDVPDLRGDPQRRPGAATRRPPGDQPQQISRRAPKYGFDKPIYVQYVKTMEKIFTGSVISYTQGFNVVDQIKPGPPATLSLAIGAGIIWLLASIVLRHARARSRPGKLRRPGADGRCRSSASRCRSFFLGAVLLYFLGYKAGSSRSAATCQLTVDPVAVVHAPAAAVVRARRCCSSASTRACCARRSSTRSARTTSAPRGRRGSAERRVMITPRPAQLADPDHLAVGPGLRGGDRRRGDPHRVGLQPPRRRPVRGASRSAASTSRRSS